jgi:hypothetical protein
MLVSHCPRVLSGHTAADDHPDKNNRVGFRQWLREMFARSTTLWTFQRLAQRLQEYFGAHKPQSRNDRMRDTEVDRADAPM